MVYEVDTRVLAPVHLKSGLAWVACMITAWHRFPIPEGDFITIYECQPLDGGELVFVSGNLLKKWRWK